MRYEEKDILADIKASPIVIAALTICRSMPREAKKHVDDKVYFVKCEGYVKIGHTRGAVEKRVEEFSLGNPFPTEVIECIDGPLALEQTLHVLFKHYHHAREWFRIEGDMEEFLKLLPSVVRLSLKDMRDAVRGEVN